jgi:hypothetical protein
MSATTCKNDAISNTWTTIHPLSPEDSAAITALRSMHTDHCLAGRGAFRRRFNCRGFAPRSVPGAISKPKISDRSSLASSFERAGRCLASGSAAPALAIRSSSLTACRRKRSSGCSSRRAPIP